MSSLRVWLADQCTRLAAERLRRRYPDWADAIVSEHASLSGQPDQLGWAFGSFRASFGLPAEADAAYPALLLLSAAAMGLYQWSADESLITLLVLCGLGLVMGLLRPTRFLLSGLVMGLVVAGVTGFETLSGIRPAYEVSPRHFDNILHWLPLVVPALLASAAGRFIGLRLLPQN